MPQSFIAEIEEGLVLLDRSAAVPAELVAMEGRLRNAFGVAEVARIHVVIPQVLVCFAVPLIDAAAGCDVHDRAGVSPILRAVGGIVHLELLHGADGRLERDLVSSP